MSDYSEADIRAWFTGRLPKDWTSQAPDITIDREEITVRLQLGPGRARLGRTDRSSTRPRPGGSQAGAKKPVTRGSRWPVEAEHRFERKVSWGATVNDTSALFTHLSVPVMTRLRQPQRQVLDTLVEAGVARSRADALQWCVKLVGQHTDDWLRDLRAAMENVQAVREQGPS